MKHVVSDASALDLLGFSASSPHASTSALPLPDLTSTLHACLVLVPSLSRPLSIIMQPLLLPAASSTPLLLIIL